LRAGARLALSAAFQPPLAILSPGPTRCGCWCPS